MTLLSSSPSSSISAISPLRVASPPVMEASLPASRAPGRSVTSLWPPGEAKELFWQCRASLGRARREPVWLHFPRASHQVSSLGLEPSHRLGGSQLSDALSCEPHSLAKGLYVAGLRPGNS